MTFWKVFLGTFYKVWMSLMFVGCCGHAFDGYAKRKRGKKIFLLLLLLSWKFIESYPFFIDNFSW